MNLWEEKKWRHSFVSRAEQMELRKIECKEKAKANPHYKYEYDGAEADWWISYRLATHTSVSSQNLLRAELLEMRQSIPKSISAYNQEDFAQQYLSKINALLREVGV